MPILIGCKRVQSFLIVVLQFKLTKHKISQEYNHHCGRYLALNSEGTESMTLLIYMEPLITTNT